MSETYEIVYISQVLNEIRYSSLVSLMPWFRLVRHDETV
jgi:hypothetical protein